jgi:thiol:disulfide interchange protein DsbC
MLRKILLLPLVGALAYQGALTAEEITPTLISTMENIIPGLKPDRIRHAPIRGLYKNLTEGERKQARIDAINGLGEDSMIVFSPKEVKHTVSVFTDITCPYCQRMHSQMSDYNALGIKVRYLAFPRAGFPSPTYNDMVSVWCADDPQKAMTDAKAGLGVTSKQCENPVRDHYLMGRTIGISGTPSIILENGEIVPGFVPPQQLAQMIETQKAELARR